MTGLPRNIASDIPRPNPSDRCSDMKQSQHLIRFFFDFRSYWQRKNPNGVIDAFERLITKTSTRDSLLVIKVNGAELEPDKLSELEQRVESMAARVVIIKETLSDNQIKNLIRC